MNESKPGAGADVDDALAGLEAPQRERVADAGEGLDRPVGQRVDDGLVVAEAGGERAAGVEVVGAVRVDGDVAVLVAHLCAQGVDVDEQVSLDMVILLLRPRSGGRLVSIRGTRLRAAGPR